MHTTTSPITGEIVTAADVDDRETCSVCGAPLLIDNAEDAAEAEGNCDDPAFHAEQAEAEREYQAAAYAARARQVPADDPWTMPVAQFPAEAPF